MISGQAIGNGQVRFSDMVMPEASRTSQPLLTNVMIGRTVLTQTASNTNIFWDGILISGPGYYEEVGMGRVVPSQNNTVECPSCGWQGASHATDAGHCPECDAECLTLKEIEEMFPDEGP